MFDIYNIHKYIVHMCLVLSAPPSVTCPRCVVAGGDSHRRHLLPRTPRDADRGAGAAVRHGAASHLAPAHRRAGAGCCHGIQRLPLPGGRPASHAIRAAILMGGTCSLSVFLWGIYSSVYISAMVACAVCQGCIFITVFTLVPWVVGETCQGVVYL